MIQVHHDDRGIIQFLKTANFPLVGGRMARVFEIVENFDAYYTYAIVFRVDDEDYFRRVDLSRPDFISSSLGEIYDIVHDSMLNATGGSKEALNCKLHKAFYGT